MFSLNFGKNPKKIDDNRPINLLSDVDKVAKEENFPIPLDVLDILKKGTNAKDIYEALLKKDLDPNYVSILIQHCISTWYEKTDIYLSVLSLFLMKNKCKCITSSYTERILACQGLIESKDPVEPYSDIMKFFPDGTIEQAIKNDNIQQFTKFVSEPDFEPNKRVNLDNIIPISFIPLNVTKNNDAFILLTRKDRKLNLMKLIAFFGAINILKSALSMGSFDLTDVGKYAVAGGNSEVIHLLEQKGVNFDECFEMSVKFNRDEISDWLLKNYRCEPISLNVAIENYNMRAFFFLLKNNINVSKEYLSSAFLTANRTFNLPLMKYLHEVCHAEANAFGGMGRNALHSACRIGSLDQVKYLVEKCKLNADQQTQTRNEDGSLNKFTGFTPLHLACRHNHLDIVKYLFEQCHVNIEAKTEEYIHEKKLNGRTAFNIVSDCGNLEIFKYLTEKCNADKSHISMMALNNVCDNGNFEFARYLVEDFHLSVEFKDFLNRTPLIYACEKGNLKYAKFLVEQLHANPERNDLRQGPIHVASRKRYLDLVKYLVEECHVSPEEKDKIGRTPMQLTGSTEIKTYLESKISK